MKKTLLDLIALLSKWCQILIDILTYFMNEWILFTHIITYNYYNYIGENMKCSQTLEKSILDGFLLTCDFEIKISKPKRFQNSYVELRI